MTPKNYKKYLVLVCLCYPGLISKTLAQEKINQQAYSAAGIPDSLKENANSVVRYSMEYDMVNGPGNMTSKVHRIVTILNEKGDREAILALFYNRKYDSYSDVSMKIYNAEGNLIKKYHKSDMEDYSATHGADLVTDGRVLAVQHSVAAYPTTIEIEYEEDTKSFLDIGGWDIQGNQQSVQNSYYHITIDQNAGFRYLNKNTTIKPTVNTVGGKSDYNWEVSNLKAIKLEEGAEAWRVLPRLYFGVNNFSFFGIAGDFSSWKSFGKWLRVLDADVTSLTPEREAEIRKMTDTIKTDKGKAKFLYNYLQQSMRYVSIQLGIGGFKPFAATFVDQKKYGDCKALANYMSALLKAVNIPSYCAVINAEANKEPADPDFPFNSFNHEILCVPFKGDTTWLECTSNTMPFGKLGSFTENRMALLITEDGGKLVNTPRSTMQDNQFNGDVVLTLNEDGSAKAKAKISATGGYREEYIDISAQKVDEQKEYYLNRFKIKQPSLFNLSTSPDTENPKVLNFELEYDKFADIMAGDKQFYKPRVFDLMTFTIPVEENRKSDYYFEHPLQKKCTTTIILPAGFEIETLPVNQNLKFTYGNFEVNYVYDQAKNQVISTAKFNISNHVIPAAKYTELQVFLDNVYKAQNKKLVIRRKA
ncbi:DUF3857 and transglutaminase domain-containing protein [Mucilaginibacter sp.]|uniref:DUF3857 and transglutaminase domain-containing protein n=1 Tax=Mucilaginibacter sp. TaxID=1882438 RepID=UPI0028403965|nr:DUF3857 and transglutaminase domain-containing protein [Mucilaginibacter sp.]MDR3696739.1 DUF3857 and transglutaminase domain-containing protein [Mucilaginibacter sp.]